MALLPAELGEDPSGRSPGMPYSALYQDRYSTEAGAQAQARTVFLAGNGLPQRWQGRHRFVILETGFGLGHNFLATWQAWREDPARCAQLTFISVDKHPVRREDLARVHGVNTPQTAPSKGPSSTDAPLAAELRQRLVAAWPVLTPGWHHLDLDEQGGRLRLMLGLGDVADLLPALLASVDAFYLDGFSPAKNPAMWDEGLMSRLNRLAAPQATAATWSWARVVRDGLSRAGFVVSRAPGLGQKRDMLRAHFEPRHVPPPLAGGLWPEVRPERRHALVIGAGLAGCSATLALRQVGWRVSLLDQALAPAQAASGNPGGLFHGIVHGDDGIHARAHRAAALDTARVLAPWLRSGRVLGQGHGLLRLDEETSAAEAQALVAQLGLPADYVAWLDQAEASALAGLPLPSGGWVFHQGGWVHPAGYAQALLAAAQAAGEPDGLSCIWGTAVKAIRREASNDGWQWQALDGEGLVLAQAPTLVLANAAQVLALLATLPPEQAVALPPMGEVRGQVTWVEGLATSLPSLPVAGSGYILPLGSGRLLCGATAQEQDADPGLRASDHLHNLQQAEHLGIRWSATPDAANMLGRVGWRATTPDRLPLIGALPWPKARLMASRERQRLDQVRQWPRARDEDGSLCILSGLGSRGITWASLAGRLLAHWVAGTPCPLEADLRDALDPARFLVREARRASPNPPPG